MIILAKPADVVSLSRNKCEAARYRNLMYFTNEQRIESTPSEWVRPWSGTKVLGKLGNSWIHRNHFCSFLNKSAGGFSVGFSIDVFDSQKVE